MACFLQPCPGPTVTTTAQQLSVDDEGRALPTQSLPQSPPLNSTVLGTELQHWGLWGTYPNHNGVTQSLDESVRPCPGLWGQKQSDLRLPWSSPQLVQEAQEEKKNRMQGADAWAQKSDAFL